VEVRQTFVLSDQNFSPVLPCNVGECLKIIRVEDGSLAELVSTWLDVFKGKTFPAGSTVVIFSASQLLMDGVGGYLHDLVGEIAKIDRIFEGRVLTTVGIPIFLGGVADPFLVRSVFELEGWLRGTGIPYPKQSWELVLQTMMECKTNRTQEAQKTKARVPVSLKLGQGQRAITWVSEGWTTLPNGVLPLSPNQEAGLVSTLTKELNGLYNLGLGTDPSTDRLVETPVCTGKPRVLMIGASHVEREALILADRGYDVTVCSKPGWRATQGAAAEMAEKVEEALLEHRACDVVVLQTLDNSLYMARTVEGGDLPIRRYPDGCFHVEGELVLAGKDRQFLVFNILKPVLQKLLGRNVVFVTPGPRYLEGCCDEIEHASNRFDEGFEDGLRRCLAECRQNFKDFLFTSGYRGFRVIDPSPALPGNNDDIWDWDPVHPSTTGYENICDLFEGEFDKFSHGGTKKRPAETQLAPEAKKRKVEVPRPRWVSGDSNNAQREYTSGYRGSGGQPPWFVRGRGRGGFRGRFAGGWRGRY